MALKLTGNCYLCGAEFGKTVIKNHILKNHEEKDGVQACYLLKVEGAYNKNYWLYIDIPFDKTLSDIDSFLRQIWLECCGHASGFFGSGRSEISKNRKLNTFAVGDKFLHEYDFGSTTETMVTIMGEINRTPQKDAVRLLARNDPPQIACAVCGSPAKNICKECIYETDNPFYCAECSEEHEHDDMLLPVVNSPRMGVCGYSGKLDVFIFDAAKEK